MAASAEMSMIEKPTKVQAQSMKLKMRDTQSSGANSNAKPSIILNS